MPGDDMAVRVGKLHLEPDDILVIKVSRKIQDLDHIESIRREWQKLAEATGLHNRILVIDTNVELSILHPSEMKVEMT